MLYKVLINKDGNEFNLNNYDLFRSRQSYDAILRTFDNVYRTQKFNFISGINVYVSKGQLIIEKDGVLNVVVLLENNNLIIDKSFKLDYPMLYKKFEPVIQQYSGQSYDITYTNYCGRTRYLEFEKPKFSTIKERDDLVNSLLDEVYN